MFSRYMYLLFLQIHLVVLCENKCKIWRPKFPRLFKCTATECGSEFNFIIFISIKAKKKKGWNVSLALLMSIHG